MAYLDDNGLSHLWALIKNKLLEKVDKEDGKTLTSNDYTDEEKTKLAGIEEGANNYTHPTYEAHYTGLYKVAVDGTGHVAITQNISKNDITGLGIPSSDTTYEEFSGCTDSADGEAGLVPAPKAGDDSKFLSADGSWEALPVVSTTNPGVMATYMYSTLLEIYNNYVSKSDITGVYKYKGSVASEANLPKSGQETGDVYNIETASSYGAAGANVAWNGTAWDSLGEIFTVESLTNTQIDAICV